jgi:PKD repeat protein
MALKTPPLNANGVYTLIAPWETVANTTYTCIAARSFQDLLQHGVDILNTYYTPMGLGQTQYQADLAAGANLITLVSPNQPTIYVPDTYIVGFPDLSNVAYQNVILSCQLGPLPDTLDLSFIQQEVAALVSDTIGVEPTVNVHVSPSTQVVTPAQAASLETARQAAITNRTTDRAEVLALQAQVQALNALVATYENLAIQNNWMGTTPAPAPAADGTTAGFTNAITGLEVVFTNTSTPGAGFTISSYAWNFGDSAGTSTEANPMYSYTTPGTYLVELTANDSNGQSAVFTASVTVAAAAPAPTPTPPPPPTIPPPVVAADGTTANFTFEASGLTVTFTDTSITDSGVTISAWGWNFGDGTGGPGTSVLQNPQYTYAQAGTYVVAMQVTDSNNQQSTIFIEVTVS